MSAEDWARNATDIRLLQVTTKDPSELADQACREVWARMADAARDELLRRSTNQQEVRTMLQRSKSETKRREKEARDDLRRGGLLLQKRDGGYMIVDESTNTAVAGTANGTAYELTLDDALEWGRDVRRANPVSITENWDPADGIHVSMEQNTTVAQLIEALKELPQDFYVRDNRRDGWAGLA
jgi:hypothetical protein